MNIQQIRTLQIGNDWFGERHGGLNRVYSELINHLPDVGVSVRGMVVGSDKIELETSGIVTGYCSPKAPLLERLKSARATGNRILREQNTDLIVVHFALYGFPLLDQLYKRPTVVHFQGPWSAETGVEGQSNLARRFQKMIELLVYARGQRLIVLSKAFEKILVERYGISEDSIRVVPAGVDYERFSDRLTRGEARSKLGWPLDRPIILSVRRQMKRMGLENLIDAAVHIRKSVPDVLILLAGSGPIASELEHRIIANGLENHVRLIGRIDDRDLPIAYRGANMTVVPSQSLEGFGMITLESLASGTPVFVTPVGGLPEVIAPFDPECVFEDTSTTAIGNLLTDFLLDRRKLPSSDACRRYAVDNFAWQQIAQKVRGVYEEALR